MKPQTITKLLIIAATLLMPAIIAYALGCGQQASNSESQQNNCPTGCSQIFYITATGAAFNATCNSGAPEDDCHNDGNQKEYYKVTVNSSCDGHGTCFPATPPTSVPSSAEKRNDKETFTGTCAS
jgi:hypothetical protein